MASLSARILAPLVAEWRGSTASPAYTALAERVRLLVLDGRIALGTRLPAERELAAQLGVSRTTVTAAYSELRHAGYLDSIRGSGSVARLPGRSPLQNEPTAGGYLDFSKAALPASALVARAAVLAAEDLPAHLGDTGFDPIGLPVLRRAIADRYTARGLPTEPEQIMVTIGAQHAIALLSRTLLGRGDSALVESPSYPHAYEALRLTGARLVPVSVTTDLGEGDEGWDVPGLEQALQRTSPAMGYVMPDFQNPTGCTMSPELRQRMLDLASAQGTTIVADETMAELDIDRAETPLPLAAYGPAVLIGSVGKTLWGGLRVGWIRAERQLIQKLARARMAGDLGTPTLEQLLVARLFADYDSILETRRQQLRAGREHLTSALAAAFPDWRMPRVEGGLTAWVNLGAPVSSQLTLAARNEGLLLAAGPRFGLDGAFERFLRIPISYSAEETDRAVAALSAAWESLARGPLFDQSFVAEVV
ncbi:MocR-like transcription factor YczR [Lacisediminihabitans changchengi]|uniref:PLP-dependent aminotransferase family protein n=1 Tax=Lacisediminihabitans changchengi TaxID=2787634 RepID=A0A934ST58_9MICO|nr:PLP-dependent aminotransferase family protein [Lacisediminihabitans changchengi]MBK4348533.1 PLP-dependent aminotransferase family protein [Lacisediminihabitans changchengi]